MNEEIKETINNSKTILNKKIHLFLFALFKNIFLKKYNKKKTKELDGIIDKINKDIIKEQDKYINKDYELKNIKNILDFVKNQNLIYCGDIIENILIYIFSYGYKAEKDSTFGQYLYNNIGKLRDPKNYDILNMINPVVFAPEEFRNFKQLLLIDISFNEINNNVISEKQKQSVLYNLLVEIYIMKYKIFSKEYYNKNILNYINKGYFDMKIYEKIYNILKDNSSTIIEQDLSANSINSFVSNFFYPLGFGKIPRASIRIIRAFLISVFIYYQNKNSPLMKYIKPNENDNSLVNIPFTYDLRGASIEGRFANIILSPLRIESRITNILLNKNNLRELGIIELFKLFIMNKNIKLVEFSSSLIKASYLKYYNYGMGVHENHTLEELNLSGNSLKEDSEEIMYKIISSLKSLKTLNISANEFRKGLSSFFVVLRKLYRKRKTKLENLYLNKCMLDEQSLYELGELLKCKYCKLKVLYINNNSFPYNNNEFWKKLKKNKSLTEIYLNRNDIWNDDVEDILRIINITGIKYLYLYKIKIADFNKLLMIINRTKLIGNKDDEDKINLDELFLTNLDLSSNEFSIKNPQHIELLTKIIEKTNLNCLDISHILYDSNPERFQKIQENLNYRMKVETLKKKLEDIREKYIDNVRELRNSNVNKSRIEISKEEEDLLKKYDKDIDNVIKKDKAKYPVFLAKEAIKILDNENNEELIKDDRKFGEMIRKMKKYMMYKRAERTIDKNKKEIRKKKLIII